VGDGSRIVEQLGAILTSPRPDAAMVERGRSWLRQRLPAELEDYLDALDRLAAPLREVIAGERIADPEDRLQAVRFTMALHVLEQAAMDGTLEEDAVDNALYMEYAQVEDAIEAALPPRPGFRARPQAALPPAPPGPAAGGPIRLD
jgi:hypothetical protein